MNEELMTLLRGANLSDEQIEEAKSLLVAEATARAAEAEELRVASAQAVGLEAQIVSAEADATELRSIVQTAIDSAAEVRASVDELTTEFATEVVRRGKFEESVSLRGARASGDETEDAELIPAERLAAMETDNQTIPAAWNEIMTSYGRNYGEFEPRFAPEMGRAPSHVAGLQAVVLPGEAPHFEAVTRSATLI